jgi:four helix bundle protein
MSISEPSAEQLAWERTCSRAITSDTLWKLDVSRAALFLIHCARADIRSIPGLRSEDALADQLLTAAASVSAHIGESYGRWSVADQLKFLSYALGSVRECMSWYEASRDRLPAAIVDERELLIARLRALLLGYIRSLRRRRRGDLHLRG